MFDPILEERLHWVSTVILRYGLAFLFLRFGIYKFIQPNVTGVQVWTAHSLLYRDRCTIRANAGSQSVRESNAS